MRPLSFQAELVSFFRPTLLRSKTSTTSESSIDKCVLFIVLSKASTVIFCYFLQLHMSLHFPLICVLSFSPH
jgi:hypothetical protein